MRFHAPTEFLRSTTTRVLGILPGGGDLRTPPDQSELWEEIAGHHDDTLFLSSRISVSSRTKQEMDQWPWNFDAGGEPTKTLIDAATSFRLREFLASEIGFMFIVGRNDVFMLPPHAVRQLTLRHELLKPNTFGEETRNYVFHCSTWLIFPYDTNTLQLLKFDHKSAQYEYFARFEEELSRRPTFSGTFASEGREPYQFHQIPIERAKNPRSIAFPEVATHAHFVFDCIGRGFNQKVPLIKLPTSTSDSNHHLISGLLNSSAALFWLKQVCFNKGAGEDEERDRFEYQGNKVEQFPIPIKVVRELRGKPDALSQSLTKLSHSCWERGQTLLTLGLRKLFDMVGEAYYEWNLKLPGNIAANAELESHFENTAVLRKSYQQAMTLQNRLYAEMIAAQEEMDWLIYGAYDLLPEGHPATRVDVAPELLDRDQRPFCIWEQAECDFARAVQLIPQTWSKSRKELWEARLRAIRDNEHIRRIEQPVYKRRWDEQWKVGNRWRCGPTAYAAEFVEAFEWWMREKAEWWLEKEQEWRSRRVR